MWEATIDYLVFVMETFWIEWHQVDDRTESTGTNDTSYTTQGIKPTTTETTENKNDEVKTYIFTLLTGRRSF